MSGIRYLIDDLDCLESCMDNAIPMSSVAAAAAGGPTVGGAASADFGLAAGNYTAFDGAAAMGGGALAAAGGCKIFYGQELTHQLPDIL